MLASSQIPRRRLARPNVSKALPDEDEGPGTDEEVEAPPSADDELKSDTAPNADALDPDDFSADVKISVKRISYS